MGVKLNLFKNTNITKFSYIETQSVCGHDKRTLNHSLNLHVLGLKHNFVFFNPEHSIEYLKRSSYFCYNTILSGGSILFINSNDVFNKLTLYFGSRCLQPVFLRKWVGGLLTNYFLKNPCVFIALSLNKVSGVLKEASKKFIPVITIEDSNYSIDKSFYSLYGNDDNKNSIYHFYVFLTDSILRSLLYKYSKSVSSGHLTEKTFIAVD